ncbi:MAG: helix-turn-helix transcriptional regulator, partial [Selenomonas sp.]
MPYKLKEMRKKRKMSQEDLSKSANVSRQTIVNLENGAPVNTTTATLRKLADALDCAISDI